MDITVVINRLLHGDIRDVRPAAGKYHHHGAARVSRLAEADAARVYDSHGF